MRTYMQQMRKTQRLRACRQKSDGSRFRLVARLPHPMILNEMNGTMTILTELLTFVVTFRKDLAFSK